MNRKSWLIGVGSAFAGAGIVMLLWGVFFSSGDETRYVSMTMVFEECKIREKYSAELKTFEESGNRRLAEMENALREMKASGQDAVTIDEEEKELYSLRDRLTEEYQRKSESFERIIWEKINQKVGEYGKEKGYDYIFGAKGDGAIMYAADAKDITKEVIAYINR